MTMLAMQEEIGKMSREEKLRDNGKVFFVSLRHWGHLMYRAWEPGGKNPRGYCKYAFGWDIPEEEYKYPQSETDFLQPDEVGNEGVA